MAVRIARKKLEAAVTELDKVRRSWMRRPGVTGLDVGFEMKGRQRTDELAVRVHVSRKVPVAALPSKAESFGTGGELSRLGDFGVDVIEADYGVADRRTTVVAAEDVDRTARVDPLVGGVSVSNALGGAGTLGAIVWDETDGEICILSNWHVLCRRNECRVGEAVYQPGPIDGGRRRDSVAELKRWRLDRDSDAALARLTGARAYSRDLLAIGPILGMADPVLGMDVVKSGRSTRFTAGTIDGVAFSFTLAYHDGTRQTFDDQVHIVPRPPWPEASYELSTGGDSGSIWLEEATGLAVGLHFAGEDDTSVTAEHAVANQIKKVAKALRFSFAPVYRGPVGEDDEVLLAAVRRVLERHQPKLAAAPGPGAEPPIEHLLREIRRELDA